MQRRLVVGRSLFMALAWLGASATVPAQTFRLTCDLQGTIPVLEDRKLRPAQVTVEMQSIGKNIFIKLVGPRYYDMKVSSLTTETFTGANLTTGGAIEIGRAHV